MSAEQSTKTVSSMAPFSWLLQEFKRLSAEQHDIIIYSALGLQVLLSIIVIAYFAREYKASLSSPKTTPRSPSRAAGSTSPDRSNINNNTTAANSNSSNNNMNSTGKGLRSPSSQTTTKDSFASSSTSTPANTTTTTTSTTTTASTAPNTPTPLSITTPERPRFASPIANSPSIVKIDNATIEKFVIGLRMYGLKVTQIDENNKKTERSLKIHKTCDRFRWKGNYNTLCSITSINSFLSEGENIIMDIKEKPSVKFTVVSKGQESFVPKNLSLDYYCAILDKIVKEMKIDSSFIVNILGKVDSKNK